MPKKIKPPYKQTLPLLHPLPKSQCWNSTNGSTADLPAGLLITVEGGYDAWNTTILASTCGSSAYPADPRIHIGGLPLTDGTLGYRFIIPNQTLGEALGVSMPKKTGDIIGDIIAYESGEASPSQTRRLFRSLKKTGIGKKLQGHYSSRC